MSSRKPTPSTADVDKDAGTDPTTTTPATDPQPAPEPDNRPVVAGPNTKMIDALIEERDGYEAAGNTERVKAVDKALASYGTTYEQAKRDRAQRAQNTAGGERQRAADDANQKMIDALLDEREGYVRMDKQDRVAQVDEQLQARGTTHEEAAEARAARTGRTAEPATVDNGPLQTR